MKPGRRALGIAESYRGRDDGAPSGAPGADRSETGTKSTLAGAVVRVDRAVDDVEVGTCTVGGLDATDAVLELWDRLDRPDVRYLVISGIAPAWYNIVDVDRIASAVDRPVLSVSFEASDGLESGIADAFDGDARHTRLEAYRSLPGRFQTTVGHAPLFVRCAGVDRQTATEVVDAFTHERRPEPIRVAKRLAHRIDAARRDGRFESG